ncbi:hypothetical protein AMQ28_13255 [Acinetobacter sp. TTH0-4]|uniref:hypothetical protein n=1 Tax=Acinetobacter sp. TTH0-4 TaxID=1646498 RepID=UPI0006AFD0AA|nr:hypothetical protein [Acinetobacter sp. TTH0-4]ALD03218.1 hypothetical protein AMQ28_13255 [Acinetobacter sp. TTH0-4]
MATDVDVQYFSHLNGLVLGNNWGDLIRLLDKALVTGIDFTQITSASVSDQGDVHITLYSAHNAMLFQVVELSGFVPASLNQKYRIKGVPSTTTLILKPKTDIVERSTTTVGTGKLASLGYEIIFRDVNDVKRVYRAKNPTAQHPFIRVDESLTSPDGTTGVYTSTYAKSAMVGLLENMTHIDDYENPAVNQLPINSTDLSRNWRITGTGSAVVRGWSKWYYSTRAVSQPSDDGNSLVESVDSVNLVKWFTIFGDKDAFYLNRTIGANNAYKLLSGCGVYTNAIDDNVVPPWFLMTSQRYVAANTASTWSSMVGSTPLTWSQSSGSFLIPKNATAETFAAVNANGLTPDYRSGTTNLYSANTVSALEIPIFDADKYLRGTLKHVCYSGKMHNTNGQTNTLLSGASLYLWETVPGISASLSGLYAYLGELE